NVAGTLWDRSVLVHRRGFCSKFLILSRGPDGQPGGFLYPDLSPPTTAIPVIAHEKNPLPFLAGVAAVTNSELIKSKFIDYSPSSIDPALPAHSYDLLQWAQDDISNHNLQSTVGIGGSGS